MRIVDNYIKFRGNTNLADHARIVAVGERRTYYDSVLYLSGCKRRNGEAGVIMPQRSLPEQHQILFYAEATEHGKTRININSASGEGGLDNAVYMMNQCRHLEYRFHALTEKQKERLEKLLKYFSRQTLKEQAESYKRSIEDIIGKVHVFKIEGQPEVKLHWYHDLTQFDPELQGHNYSELRNILRRAEKAHVFVEPFSKKREQLYRLMIRWNDYKLKKLKKELEAVQNNTDSLADNVQYFERKQPIASFAKALCYGHSPMLEIYTARVTGATELTAAVAVVVFGESAYMKTRVQNFKVPKAMELLEYRVMLMLKSRGVKTLSRGFSSENAEEENPLIQYKKKFPFLQSEKRYTVDVICATDEELRKSIDSCLHQQVVGV